MTSPFLFVLAGSIPFPVVLVGLFHLFQAGNCLPPCFELLYTLTQSGRLLELVDLIKKFFASLPLIVMVLLSSFPAGSESLLFTSSTACSRCCSARWTKETKAFRFRATGVSLGALTSHFSLPFLGTANPQPAGISSGLAIESSETISAQ